MKFFNWSFELQRAITLSMGEGPGEIKQSVLSACVVNEKTYLIGLMEKRINVYDRKGLFIKAMKLDFIPKKMVCYEDKIYIFNVSFLARKKSPLLGKIIYLNLKNSEKDIILKDDLELNKSFNGNPVLLGLSSIFDVGDNKKIYLLISTANVLFEIGENGKLIDKTNLPYKERIVFRTIKGNDEEQRVISVLDWYQDMKVLKNVVFTCFLKHIKKDKKTGRDIYHTYVIKHLENGKYSEKIFDGNFVIIGEHKGNLFLFNTESYQVLNVKLTEW